ncbi:MAG: MBL fold metallo-hydrolase RNA specificity domain-containing protein [Acetobacteraceae bacterium]
MKLSFHGAARMVTGSCHLVEAAGRRVLVDCGMIQGGPTAEAANAAPFGFDPAAIDCVLLTHAHLDHCGRLPLLVKQGFRGSIIATAATRDLARLVLLDAAHLQEEETRRAAAHAARHGRHHHGRGRGAAGAPLYTLIDALEAMGRFAEPAVLDREVALGPGLTARFVEAGHILGSASILLTAREEATRRVLFSGDLGAVGRPLLPPPAVPPAADLVVMETTYGDRAHRAYADSVSEFLDAVAASFARGGNVVIPTFALERAQELLFALRGGIASGRLAAAMQVYLDSPMAISATELFERHPEALAPSLAAAIGRGEDPFALPGLHFVRETAASMALNAIRGGAVLMAGSGMATGGRVRHHLRHNLGRPEAAVIFVGYAAEGTLARLIIDGAQSVRLFGETIPVRAQVHTINGFSGHADQAGLLAWRRAVPEATRTILVHGEARAMDAFAPLLAGEVIRPELGASVSL